MICPLSSLPPVSPFFADDAKCAIPIYSSSHILLLQDDLSRVAEWSSTWNILLNEIVHVHFNRSSQPCPPYLNDYYKCLPNESTQKDLGILVSADLQWSCHIQHVISKAYKVLGMLWRHFCSAIAIKAKRFLYLSLVRPHLLYCSPLWHPHMIVHIKSLESAISL